MARETSDQVPRGRYGGFAGCTRRWRSPGCACLRVRSATRRMVKPDAASATRQIARGAVACDCTRALAQGDDASGKPLAVAPSRRVSTRKDSEAGLCPLRVGRLRRRASEPSRLLRAVRLLIPSRSDAKTGEAWALASLRPKSAGAWPLPSFACSQPILVETRSVKDLIRGSLGGLTLRVVRRQGIQ